MNLLLKVAFFALGACAAEADMNNGATVIHEEVSSKLLAEHFSDIEELKKYLNEFNVEYILKEDAIGGQPPQAASTFSDFKGNLYYLVLLPKNRNKLYRFRAYATEDRGLHLESDFSYKNPYQ